MTLFLTILIQLTRWLSNGLLVVLLLMGVYFLLKKRVLNNHKIDQLFNWSVKIFLVHTVIGSLDSASLYFAFSAFGGNPFSGINIIIASVTLLVNIFPATMIFLERNKNLIRVRRWIWFVLVLQVVSYLFSFYQLGSNFYRPWDSLVTISTLMPPIILLLLVRQKLRNIQAPEEKE